VPYNFKICIATLKGRDILEGIAINGRIMYFEGVVLKYVD